eukprot:1236260-Rhodomonas_salina.2
MHTEVRVFVCVRQVPPVTTRSASHVSLVFDSNGKYLLWAEPDPHLEEADCDLSAVQRASAVPAPHIDDVGSLGLREE